MVETGLVVTIPPFWLGVIVSHMFWIVIIIIFTVRHYYQNKTGGNDDNKTRKD